MWPTAPVEPFSSGRRVKFSSDDAAAARRRQEAARRRLAVEAVQEPPAPDVEGRPAAWAGPHEGEVYVSVGGQLEKVLVDRVKGPWLAQADGSYGFMPTPNGLPWHRLAEESQKSLLYRAARTNRALRMQDVGSFWHPSNAQKKAEAAADEAERAKAEAEVKERARALEAAAEAADEARWMELSEREKLERRCGEELAKGIFSWRPVGIEDVASNHERVAPGMIYGLDFPWNEALLAEFGARWLTKAFKASGVLRKSNRVTALHLEKKIKVTGGNNAGKFLFEVEYAKPQPHLHTRLFAKCPFMMTPETKSDRFSSSVYKQPNDLQEINAYRIYEGALPVATPKYYFGDISNETTNFILITERVLYARYGADRGDGPLKPYEVEGPHDKCKDHELNGPPEEYYTVLMVASARIAACHKTGKFGDGRILAGMLKGQQADTTDPALWGVNPFGPSGEDPKSVWRKLDVAIRFAAETALVAFQPYIAEAKFREKFMTTMMTWSAYQMEIEFWKSCDPDYVALGHANLNSDNAYFWRDEAGRLECGIFDWGGFGVGSLGHKLWWIINCADFEQVSLHLSHYLDTFIAVYEEEGGPRLQKEKLMRMVKMTALGNIMFMVAAVPNCHKMCKVKEWATIKDKNDPRIAGNIDGKSTLRTTLHVLDHGFRQLEESALDQELEKWVEDVYVKEWGLQRKTPEMIGLP